MLFRSQASGLLAISQLTHAWISGQILRAWDGSLAEELLLAAEQHDIGWMDWETAPSFNPQTGRPHLFREVGASVHAPMWIRGVERAHAAWGSHVALLISRHGGVIYRRYVDRRRMAEKDALAAKRFLETQAPIETHWAQMLGLDASALRRETALVALADTLSLALCGDLKAPMDVEGLGRDGEPTAMRLIERDRAFEFTLSPWPFRPDAITLEGEARAMPPSGRFADESAMRSWLAAPDRVAFKARLARPS